MATTLRVTPEVARSTSAEMQAKSLEIRNITTNVSALIDSLTGRVWSGEAETAYLNSYHATLGNVEQLLKLVEDNALNLNQIAVAYSAAESDSATRSGSLDKSFLD